MVWSKETQYYRRRLSQQCLSLPAWPSCLFKNSSYVELIQQSAFHMISCTHKQYVCQLGSLHGYLTQYHSSDYLPCEIVLNCLYQGQLSDVLWKPQEEKREGRKMWHVQSFCPRLGYPWEMKSEGGEKREGRRKENCFGYCCKWSPFQILKKMNRLHEAVLQFSWALDFSRSGASRHIREEVDQAYNLQDFI